MRRPNFSDIRAAWWTVRGVVLCQRQLAKRNPDEIDLPSSGRIPQTAQRAVLRTLRHTKTPCLASALIVQGWRSDHGELVDVIIGVRGPSSGFAAHAWLEDSNESFDQGFEPIHRVAPKRRVLDDRGAAPTPS